MFHQFVDSFFNLIARLERRVYQNRMTVENQRIVRRWALESGLTLNSMSVSARLSIPREQNSYNGERFAREEMA